jgi:hypothetical protein
MSSPGCRLWCFSLGTAQVGGPWMISKLNLGILKSNIVHEIRKGSNLQIRHAVTFEVWIILLKTSQASQFLRGQCRSVVATTRSALPTDLTIDLEEFCFGPLASVVLILRTWRLLLCFVWSLACLSWGSPDFEPLNFSLTRQQTLSGKIPRI